MCVNSSVCTTSVVRSDVYQLVSHFSLLGKFILKGVRNFNNPFPRFIVSGDHSLSRLSGAKLESFQGAICRPYINYNCGKSRET